MELTRILFEAHACAATVYVADFLDGSAAESVLARLETLTPDTGTFRLDLRGVTGIDAESFVQIARGLNRWRATRRRRVHIVFPKRSERPTPKRHLQLLDQNQRDPLDMSYRAALEPSTGRARIQSFCASVPSMNV